MGRVYQRLQKITRTKRNKNVKTRRVARRKKR